MTMHVSQRALSLALERKNDDGAGALVAEVKAQLNDIQRTFAEIKAKDSEKVSKRDLDDVVRKEAIDKLDQHLDSMVTKFEQEIAALKRMPRGGDDMQTKTAEQIAHQKAFDLYIRKGAEHGLSDLEQKALSVGSDPDGGYFVTPDTSGRMVEKIYESSPIRQIASVQNISTDKLKGIEDLGEAGAGWIGETASRAETTTPQVGEWEIEVFEMYAKPKATQKLLEDAAINAEQWLADKVAARMARLEATAFVSGNGILKPKGFTAYTTAADDGTGVTWGTIGHIVSGANGDFASTTPVDKLFDLVGTLKADFLTNARFVTRRTVMTKMRKFKDGLGNYLWSPPTAAAPQQFMGFPVTMAEDMPALATGSLSLAFGDFRAGYQIVDRLGTQVLRDPYSAKPYVEFYTRRRVGGAVVNFEAIKLMKFSAS